MFAKFKLNIKPLFLTAAVASALMLGSVAFADTASKGSDPAKQAPQEKSSPEITQGCDTEFSDIPPGSPFYSFIKCLACENIVSGYPDGTFGQNNPITRGQLSKIISNAIPLNNNPGSQLFADVPPGHTFYDFINRLAQLSIISGYDCGGPGEPCEPYGYKYFRPGANATRGQIAKIISSSQGFSEDPGLPMFQDMPQDAPFYAEVQRLAKRGIISGYACGGPGEPCAPPNQLPYFRPGANATRGQVAKMVANTFVDCSSYE